jgi:hypothetical protein
MYIQAPYIPKAITITKGKVPRVKRAKRNEVPEFYRKKKFAEKIHTHLDKLKPYLSEILLHIIGIAEFIRKGIKHERT